MTTEVDWPDGADRFAGASMSCTVFPVCLTPMFTVDSTAPRVESTTRIFVVLKVKSISGQSQAKGVQKIGSFNHFPGNSRGKSSGEDLD